MGALYHLKQKLVDFCNVIQENVSRTDTVPSSKVVYDLKADSDSQISDLNDSLTNRFIAVYGIEKCTAVANVTTIPTGDFDLEMTFDHELSRAPIYMLFIVGQTYVQWVSAYNYSKTKCRARFRNNGSQFTVTQWLVGAIAFVR